MRGKLMVVEVESSYKVRMSSLFVSILGLNLWVYGVLICALMVEGLLVEVWLGLGRGWLIGRSFWLHCIWQQ
jgi:hypothetical protein